MNTPSHWLMTMALARWAKTKTPSANGTADSVAPRSNAKTIPKWALGLGAIAPDISLYFLSFGGIWYFTQVLEWSNERTFPHLFKELFYNHPGWIIPHNLFHSPTSVILMLVLAGAGCRLMDPSKRLFRVARWLLFFLLACLFHSAVDVATHFDDGPLLLFPFNWSWRFSSPISYWDPQHYGRQFMVFETFLNVAIVIGFQIVWAKERRQR